MTQVLRQLPRGKLRRERTLDFRAGPRGLHPGGEEVAAIVLREPDGGISHAGQGAQHALDLERMDFLAADIRALPGAANQHKFAARVPFTDIAHEPAAAARGDGGAGNRRCVLP